MWFIIWTNLSTELERLSSDVIVWKLPFTRNRKKRWWDLDYIQGYLGTEYIIPSPAKLVQHDLWWENARIWPSITFDYIVIVAQNIGVRDGALMQYRGI